MSPRDLATLISTFSSSAMVIWSIIHAHHRDTHQSEKDRTQWERWIIAQVKANSDESLANMHDKLNALQNDFDNLTHEKNQIVQQYEKQMLVLRRINHELRQENSRYRKKYGRLP